MSDVRDSKQVIFTQSLQELLSEFVQRRVEEFGEAIFIHDGKRRSSATPAHSWQLLRRWKILEDHQNSQVFCVLFVLFWLFMLVQFITIACIPQLISGVGEIALSVAMLMVWHHLYLVCLLNPSLQETIQLTVSHWLLSHPAVPKFLCFLWWCYHYHLLPLHIKSFSPFSPPCRLSTFNRSTSGISRNIDRSQRYKKNTVVLPHADPKHEVKSLLKISRRWEAVLSGLPMSALGNRPSCQAERSFWFALKFQLKVSRQSVSKLQQLLSPCRLDLPTEGIQHHWLCPCALGQKAPVALDCKKSILSCQFHAIS